MTDVVLNPEELQGAREGLRALRAAHHTDNFEDWPTDDPERGEPAPPGGNGNGAQPATTGWTADDGKWTPPANPLDPYRIDWDQLWHGDPAPEWLIEPVVAFGRAHVIYSPAKTGKSLLLTWLAAQAATGQPILGQPPQDHITVLYCDLEMSPDDLRDRLDSMGYGPDSDLQHLHWLSLPPLTLDTADGAKELIGHAVRIGAQWVIIDTTARAVGGEENSADTYRAFARHTGNGLKRAGIAYTRADHQGKDPTKGMRGSSAKADDVDVVVSLTVADANTYILTATHSRMAWVPKRVKLTLTEDPTGYRLTDLPAWPAGTADIAQQLDEIGADVGIGRRAARQALKTNNLAGTAPRDTIIAAAIRYRKQRAAADRTGEPTS